MAVIGHQSAEQIAERAFDLNLLDDRQLQEVWSSLGSRNVSGEELVQLLLRRELLTNYQLERLLKGERSGYFYGDYKVLYRVATGSFARVYRAVHKDTGKVVALKVLRRRHSDKMEQTDQFYREGQMGRTLRHPNIVPIFDVFSEGMTHYLVMEFIEGQNLREFVKARGKIDAAEAVQLMIDVTAGLNYAFDRGISHRDIKMTNILVSSRGQAKLVDFGLAAADERATDETITEAENPRTIDYAGLERATGVHKDDLRSDIYFLGCIFYHMLTGRPALQETKDRIQRLARTRFEEVVPMQRLEPNLPKPVIAIVRKAMELEPERRYQTPGQMHMELKMAAQRMQVGSRAGVAVGGATDVNRDGAEHDQIASGVLAPSEQRVLMFVESNPKMQDIFRDGLKRSGYRVLLISDPERALARFNGDEKVADLVVFSTGHLGQAALEAFNAFGERPATQRIPAVLLLGHKQESWKAEAQLDQHRVVLSMPLKLKEFRATLGKLLPAGNS